MRVQRCAIFLHASRRVLRRNPLRSDCHSCPASGCLRHGSQLGRPISTFVERIRHVDESPVRSDVPAVDFADCVQHSRRRWPRRFRGRTWPLGRSARAQELLVTARLAARASLRIAPQATHRSCTIHGRRPGQSRPPTFCALRPGFDRSGDRCYFMPRPGVARILDAAPPIVA
jgi:hypothetical protein